MDEVLERRLRQLRAIGAYPPYGRPLIIAPDSTETDTARDLVVIARTPEEDAAAHALRERLQRKIYIIDSHATAEDVAAALAHSSGAAAAPLEWARAAATSSAVACESMM